MRATRSFFGFGRPLPLLLIDKSRNCSRRALAVCTLRATSGFLDLFGLGAVVGFLSIAGAADLPAPLAGAAVFGAAGVAVRVEPERRMEPGFFDPLRPEIPDRLDERPAAFFERDDLVRPTRSKARTS